MDLSLLTQISDHQWRLEPRGSMLVPGVLFGDTSLLQEMDEKVLDQVSHVASLPGIVKASFAMPDAHWGYGFPIGGVAAFNKETGVVSAGGVGFDISCGVRTILTGLSIEDIRKVKEKLADTLFHTIPAGVGSRGFLRLSIQQLNSLLEEGARWAVSNGYGTADDLIHTECGGFAQNAAPDAVSMNAKERQQSEMGTLGSGNHYLEVQEVTAIFDKEVAASFGLKKGDIVVSIHCGSRGLGHQVATDYSRKMLESAQSHGIHLPDRDLACAPIGSSLGQQYLGAMRSAINCALANRQILTHLTRSAFSSLFPHAELSLLYDVSHNTCLEEEHLVYGKKQPLFVHRKGATRAFGPGHPSLPPCFQKTGQPVLIGGTMGTASYILAGTTKSEELAFSSSCHGAGRQMSRTQATHQWHGKDLIESLSHQGILIRCTSYRGVAEEAPGAYKDVDAVVESAHIAGLSTMVAKLKPIICVKG